MVGVHALEDEKTWGVRLVIVLVGLVFGFALLVEDVIETFDGQVEAWEDCCWFLYYAVHYWCLFVILYVIDELFFGFEGE